MKIFGFDTESRMSSFDLGCKITLWTLYNDTEKHHGFDTESFIDFLKAQEESTVIVAYNLTYDWQNAFGEHDLTESFERVFIGCMGTKPRFCNLSRKKYIRGEQGKKRVTHYFIDLGNFVTYSDADNKDLQDRTLIGIAKAFEVEGKLEAPPNFEMSEKLIEYCYQDSKICFDIYSKYFYYPVIDTTGRVRGVRRTIASVAFSTLKEMSGWESFKRKYPVRKAEKESYYGGRTWVKPDYRGVLVDWVRKIDAVSMYPFVMWDMKVPVKFNGEERFGLKNQLKKLHAHFSSYREVGFRFNAYKELKVEFENAGYAREINAFESDLNFREFSRKIKEKEHERCLERLEGIQASNTLTANCYVTVYLNTECLPVREEKLSYPKNCVVSGWYVLEEIWQLYKMGDLNILEASFVYVYDCKKGLFKSFVDKYFESKCHSLGAKRICDKLILNSSYGKFAEVRRITKEIPEDHAKVIQDSATRYAQYLEHPEMFEKRPPRPIDDYEGNKAYFNNGLWYIAIRTDNEAWGRCTMIASMITARARVELWKKCKEVNGIYTDTDSVATLTEQPIGEKHVLGSWTYEGEAGVFCAFAPKHYYMSGKMTLKGIPSKRIQLWAGVYVFDIMVKPRQAKTRGLQPFQLIRTTKIMNCFDEFDALPKIPQELIDKVKQLREEKQTFYTLKELIDAIPLELQTKDHETLLKIVATLDTEASISDILQCLPSDFKTARITM